MGTCILADLTECHAVGRAVTAAAAKAGRRVVFVASSALSHRLVRDPASWPTDEDQKADRRFVGLLQEGRTSDAWQFLNGYAARAQVEMGGRNLASMLGVLDGIGCEQLAGKEYGEYGPSSGAGHTNFGICALAGSLIGETRRVGLLDPLSVHSQIVLEITSVSGRRVRARLRISLLCEEKYDVASFAVQLAVIARLRSFRAGARPGEQNLGRWLSALQY